MILFSSISPLKLGITGTIGYRRPGLRRLCARCRC